MKKTLTILFALVLAISIINCGGSTSSGSSSSVESNSAAIAQSCLTTAVNSSTYANMSINQPALIKNSYSCVGTDPITCTIDCESGDFEFEYSQSAEEMSMTYNSCEFDDVSMDGEITMDYDDSGATETITMEYVDFTVTEGSETMTMSGEMSMSIDGSTGDATIGWDSFGGTDVDGTAFSVDGSITMSTGNILNGSMTVTYGNDSATCTFSNFDVDTATQTDWENACSA